MKNTLYRYLKIELIFLFLFVPLLVHARNFDVSLDEGFRNPPESAKLRTWWHWTNSNITKEGITKDLEWMKRSGIPVGRLCTSDDGNNFRTVVILPGAQLYRAGKVETVSFPETTAKYFRFEFTGAPMRPADVMAETTTLPDSVYNFSEIKLHSDARINRWEDKAGLLPPFQL